MPTVDCIKPGTCRVQYHHLNTGASAKCGASVGARSRSVDVRVPALVGAGASRGSSLSLRPPHQVSPAQWADMRDDLVAERAAHMVDAENGAKTAADRNEHNFLARGLSTAIVMMDEVDECDTVSLSREINAEMETVHHVAAKLAGLRLAAEMLFNR